MGQKSRILGTLVLCLLGVFTGAAVAAEGDIPKIQTCALRA